MPQCECSQQGLSRTRSIALIEVWKNEFAGSPEVIGKTLFLNGIAFTVIGVTPEGFGGPDPLVRLALYVPLAMEPRLTGEPAPTALENRGARGMSVFGRLKPGVSLSEAAAEAQVISRQLAQAHPETNKASSLEVTTETRARLRQGVGNALIVGFLLALAAVVLLIACANVMNLLLSRASARSREIAVRVAIGAGRGRLVRQLFTESLVIAVLGGTLGLLVAQAGVDLFSRIPIPSDIPVTLDLRLDSRVLWFALAVSVASAFLFGMAPALQSTRPDLVPALKSGPAGGGKRRRFLGRNLLVMGQVAGSVVLLVFATQAYRGASVLLSSPTGFRTDHLLMASFDPSLARSTAPQAQAFYRQLLEGVRTLTGVRSAALSQAAPIAPAGVNTIRVVPEGIPLPPGAEAATILSTIVSDGYFTATGIPLERGREFQPTDRADSPRVAVVNEAFARQYYPNRSAIGKRFRLGGPAGTMTEIVGVAKQSQYVFAVEPPFRYVYLPLSQNPQSAMTLLLQTAGPSATLAGPLRDLVRSLDPGQPVIGLRTMEDYFDQRARQTLNVLLKAIAGMGLLGLVIALVGLYGLMTYSVGLRQREIGIRMAVGADARGVLTMVLKHGMVLAGSGVAAGLVFSLLAGKPATTAIGTSYFDLPLLALVAVLLLGAAAAGAYVPARRASLLDPNIVLRQE